ncbi:YdcF family protein [Vibrio amylolyticus]|uniref:YdcF family protein n=1 Tax=Vibrio amylolyticus TaxID=2847292 RepID=UPI00355059D7
MIYFQHAIEKIYSYSIDKQKAFDLIKKNQLDNWFVEINNLRTELSNVQRLLVDLDYLSQDEFTKVFTYADDLQTAIIKFYEEWYQDNPFHGDKDAYKDPNFVVVLGSNPHTSDERIHGAVSWIQQSSSKAKVVLTGGGFSSAQTEAQHMSEVFASFKLPNTVFLENYAMDTIGNAWFSKNLLRQQGLLLPNTKILVVTSCFHVIRSLFFFKQIFGEDFLIASHGVKTCTGSIDTVSAEEMVKEYNSVQSLNIFNQETPQDDQDILLKLLQNHDLYKNRYDLIRMFLKKSL